MAPGRAVLRATAASVLQLSQKTSPMGTVAARLCRAVWSWERCTGPRRVGKGDEEDTGPLSLPERLRAPLSAEGPPLTNTTFPHVMPLVTLLERDDALVDNPEPWESTDNGVEVVMAHLEAARMVAHHGGLYHTNAEVKLQGKRGGTGTAPQPLPPSQRWTVHPAGAGSLSRTRGADSPFPAGFQGRAELLEVFSTEFQLRLLWGSRGAESSQAERYEKFDKVLTALSHKLEPAVRFSEL